MLGIKPRLDKIISLLSDLEMRNKAVNPALEKRLNQLNQRQFLCGHIINFRLQVDLSEISFKI